VQADGSLTNERQFAWYGGDGTAATRRRNLLDRRRHRLAVLSPKGELIGSIPVSAQLNQRGFAARTRRPLRRFRIRDVQIFSLPTIARG
jgi:hypothetical protein